MKVNINTMVHYLFLFFCFFPFIGPKIGMDTMPFALLCGLLILCSSAGRNPSINVHIIKYKKYVLAVFIPILYWAFISIIFLDVFSVVKRLLGYISYLFIPLAANIVLNEMGRERYQKILKVSIFVWGAVGLIQLCLNRNFMVFLLSLNRTSDNRGVTSLASEPSYYGYMCFFMLLMVFDLEKNRYIYVILCLLQIVVCAQSSVTILYLCILGFVYGMYSLKEFNFRKQMYVVLSATGTGFVMWYMLMKHPGSRLATLIRMFTRMRFEQILKIDQSLYERFNVIQETFQGHGIPHFMGSKKIISAWGGIYYEVGFLLVFIMLFSAYIIWSSDRKIGGVLAVTFSIIMFSAINLSSPMVGLYIGYCLWKHKKDWKEVQ